MAGASGENREEMMSKSLYQCRETEPITSSNQAAKRDQERTTNEVGEKNSMLVVELHVLLLFCCCFFVVVLGFSFGWYCDDWWCISGVFVVFGGV